MRHLLSDDDKLMQIVKTWQVCNVLQQHQQQQWVVQEQQHQLLPEQQVRCELQVEQEWSEQRDQLHHPVLGVRIQWEEEERWVMMNKDSIHRIAQTNEIVV